MKDDSYDARQISVRVPLSSCEVNQLIFIRSEDRFVLSDSDYVSVVNSL